MAFVKFSYSFVYFCGYFKQHSSEMVYLSHLAQQVLNVYLSFKHIQCVAMHACHSCRIEYWIGLVRFMATRHAEPVFSVIHFGLCNVHILVVLLFSVERCIYNARPFISKSIIICDYSSTFGCNAQQ